MYRSKIYLLSVIVLTTLSSWSQKIFFEQLTTAEGLPSDYVNSVFRDSKGFLWIATDKGVCRYDGHSFFTFNKDNGLTSNFVYAVTEDLQNNIWFGTFEGGICKYDGQTISTIPLDTLEFKTIFRILFNPDGSLFIVSGRQHLFFLETINSSPQKIITSSDCYSIVPFETGKFIFGGTDGLYSLTQNGNKAFSIHQLWKARSGEDLTLCDLVNGRFITKEKDSIVVYLLSGNTAHVEMKTVLPALTKQNVRWVYMTDANQLWMSLANGLAYKDETGKIEFFSNENGLSGSYISRYYRDNENTFYLCTFGGGVKIWPGPYIREFKINGKVNSIFPGNKTTYITTTSGVYKYEPGKKITEYKNLSFDNFTSSYQSPDGQFYLGTYNSFLKLPDESVLFALNKTSKKKYEISLWTGVSGFLSQPDNKLLVSTYGEGLEKYDAANRIIDQMRPGNKRMGSGLVEFLKPLKHSIAALSFNAGITLTTSDGKTIIISKQNGLLSNSVYSVFQEKENEIWIGTLDGLNLYKGQKIVKTFSYKEGFLGSKVICIFRDSLQRFWILSDKYLHLLEGDHLRPIRSHPLLYSKNSINRAEYDKKTDLLYLGLTDAFTVVDMKKIIPDTTVHSPQVISMLNGNSSLKGNDEISSHSSGKIVIRFANQQFPIMKQNDIYYQLKGYDDDWKLLDESSEINYSKLSSGKYELIARSVNPDFYTSNEISIVKFETLPPVWKRSWFILLSLIVLLLIVYFISNRYSKKKYEARIRKMQEQHQLQLERERIARELHDNVGSQLTYLINKIEDEDGLLTNKQEAEHLSNFAREAMKELRETIWALDKKEILPEELGNKVQQLLRLYNNNGQKIELEWQHNNGLQRPLNSLEALNIYRIIQEAVNNAVKYSKASVIKVSADFNERNFKATVVDNGKGFDVQQTETGYGLLNMKKRAEEMSGELQITSAMGKGTTIYLIINQD